MPDNGRSLKSRVVEKGMVPGIGLRSGKNLRLGIVKFALWKDEPINNGKTTNSAYRHITYLDLD